MRPDYFTGIQIRPVELKEKNDQFELLLEVIEASRAEAEMPPVIDEFSDHDMGGQSRPIRDGTKRLTVNGNAQPVSC